MSTILREIEQRQLLKQREVPAHRWSSWAQSLVERHRRISLRHGALALTLAERLRAVYLFCQRWVSYAWRFSPQISLAIRAILRDTVDNGTSIFLTHPTHPEFRSINAPADESARVRPRGLSKIGDHDRWEAGLVMREHLHLLRSVSTSPLMPLSYVFGRLDPREPVTHSRQSLNVPASLQLARRVVEERQRVEVRSQRTTVVRQQTGVTTTSARRAIIASPSGIRPSVPAESSVGLSASTLTQVRSHASPSADTWPAPPAVNIEQLTEQVVRRLDHRIMAYRERLGKPV